MKKQILTLISVVFITVAFAQSKADREVDSTINMIFPIDKATSKITFEKIVVSDLSKSQQFVNAKKWIATRFNDYKTVVKLEDESSGIIIIKGATSKKESYDKSYYNYTIELTIKDIKARIKIYDIYQSYYKEPGGEAYESIEKFLETTRNRKDKNKSMGIPYLHEYKGIITSIIDEISKAIVIKDTF